MTAILSDKIDMMSLKIIDEEIRQHFETSAIKDIKTWHRIISKGKWALVAVAATRYLLTNQFQRLIEPIMLALSIIVDALGIHYFEKV